MYKIIPLDYNTMYQIIALDNMKVVDYNIPQVVLNKGKDKGHKS